MKERDQDGLNVRDFKGERNRACNICIDRASNEIDGVNFVSISIYILYISLICSTKYII